MPLGIRGRLLAEIYILLRRKLVPSGLECCTLRICMGSCNKKREQQESSRYREWRSVDQDWPADFPFRGTRFCLSDTQYVPQIALRSRMALLVSGLL